MKPDMAGIALIALTLSSTPFQLKLEPATIVPREPTYSIYELAEMVTGAPADILYGIACTESGQNDNAVGDQGRSHGRFQLNERFRAARVEKCGEYDPHCAMDAAIVAGRIYMADLKSLGDQTLAICAYRQGARGVRKNGATTWYSDRVYRQIAKKGT